MISNKAKIYKNCCSQYGGGIYRLPNKLFVSDKGEIDKMIYDNKTKKRGDNLYPLENSG